MLIVLSDTKVWLLGLWRYRASTYMMFIGIRKANGYMQNS
ncbi:hypothetical protein G1C97_0007 [Bifidobacterium sp. DSM 109959]|uniref:Uncharacterized protein n=1 Tax=Bifidobacterium olomucense TaxID=2675324 RepID=A0A7Y0EVA6_9BIFI|nr:hypothetical protein [Bifidobacterium sp. DSM 109959]